MIRINEQYGIEVNGDEYKAKAFFISEKGNNQGKESNRNIGYYTSLYAALKAVRDQTIRNSLSEYDGDLYGAIKLIKTIDDKFWTQAKEVTRES